MGKTMKMKYYLRGLATGIVIAAILMALSSGGKKDLSDKEIKERAAAMGMVMPDTTLASVEKTLQQDEKGSGEAAGAESEAEETQESVNETEETQQTGSMIEEAQQTESKAEEVQQSESEAEELQQNGSKAEELQQSGNAEEAKALSGNEKRFVYRTFFLCIIHSIIKYS